MSKLFTEFKVRGTTFRNRLWVSPMCQYSSVDGLPNDWHLVHLGSRAAGGAGAVIVEASAISPEGRISPSDSGIWTDVHAEEFVRITRFIKDQGSVPGIQIAHAGRKASTAAPWNGGKKVEIVDGGWEVVAPSAIAFDDDYPMPREMDPDDIEKVLNDFVSAAVRSVNAGFEVIELHAAHGYLLHEFLSPLSNKRMDEYGGDFAGRAKLPLEVAAAVREAVPEHIPIFVRISATDWAEGGWDLEQSIEFAKKLKGIGIDLIDCSSGGLVTYAQIPVEPNYQVAFAEAIRREAGIATAAVGLITEPQQAEAILEAGQADAIMVARQFLREPYLAFRAAQELGGNVEVPKQYGRAIDLR
jgi:2,4-dienoyl-CoA reductase-like NADH-dependent reductase (Old Yellow Enzyme family)